MPSPNNRLPDVPLGERNDKHRTCLRVVTHAYDGNPEVYCGAEAIQHIIFRWDPQGDDNDPNAWDHGFACAEHWREFQTRWNYEFAHPMNDACGMPGSRCFRDENTCRYDDIPTTEPVRAVAAEIPVPVLAR